MMPRSERVRERHRLSSTAGAGPLFPGTTLGRVSLLRRTKADRDAPGSSASVDLTKTAADTSAAGDEAPAGKEAPVGKGRPTPKRRDAQGIKRGPVAPPPMTQREAMRRAKESSKSLTKEERRALAAERRKRMARGDQDSLLARDRGPVREWVRDQVDQRFNLAGLLMPLAIASFIVLLVPNPYVQAYGPMVMLVAILAAVVDGIVFGRQLGRRARAQFPNGDPTGLSMSGRALGFYAFNRATLPRRWRIPKAKPRSKK